MKILYGELWRWKTGQSFNSEILPNIPVRALKCEIYATWPAGLFYVGSRFPVGMELALWAALGPSRSIANLSTSSAAVL